jgi:hypothetical protein
MGIEILSLPLLLDASALAMAPGGAGVCSKQKRVKRKRIDTTTIRAFP